MSDTGAGPAGASPRRAGRVAGIAAVAALGCAGLFAACGEKGGEGRAAMAAPSPAPAAGTLFVDGTAASGLNFRHVNGATGQKYMQETLGSGLCVFDYDGDGRPDVFFVQSGALPGYQSARPPRSALYRNLGGGRFADVTATAGVGGPDRYGFGCSAADIDGDGDRDLYVTYYGPNVLYRNNGDGTFTDVTRAAGVGDPLWGASAGFADADGDGDLDLYVANYVDFHMENNLYCGDDRPGYRTVCHPRNFDSQPDRMYRNRGDGTFEEVSAQVGMVDRTGKGLGLVWGDYDGDGDEDLYVANDDTPNFLYRNNGDGTFTEVGDLAGVSLSEDGVPQAGMGTDMADYDGDGRLDIIVTNLAEETNELYHNDGGGVFSDRTFMSGLGGASLLTLGFGTFFFDPDQNGDLDLFVANGHIIDNIELYSDTITFHQKAQLYRNDGHGRFTAYPGAGPTFQTPYVGRGAVPFDVDDDGDEDILMSQNNGPAVLMLNRYEGPDHWIGVSLKGRPPNGDAIGATVVVEAGGRRWLRYARTAMSYQSQGDPRLHFGLGTAGAIDRITVRWPGRQGFEEVFPGPPVDRYVTLEEGTGRRTGRRAGFSGTAAGGR